MNKHTIDADIISMTLFTDAEPCGEQTHWRCGLLKKRELALSIQFHTTFRQVLHLM